MLFLLLPPPPRLAAGDAAVGIAHHLRLSHQHHPILAPLQLPAAPGAEQPFRHRGPRSWHAARRSGPSCPLAHRLRHDTCPQGWTPAFPPPAAGPRRAGPYSQPGSPAPRHHLPQYPLVSPTETSALSPASQYLQLALALMDHRQLSQHFVKLSAPLRVSNDNCPGIQDRLPTPGTGLEFLQRLAVVGVPLEVGVHVQQDVTVLHPGRRHDWASAMADSSAIKSFTIRSKTPRSTASRLIFSNSANTRRRSEARWRFMLAMR